MLKLHIFELKWRMLFYFLSCIISFFIISCFFESLLFFILPVQLYNNNIINEIIFPFKLSLLLSFFLNCPYLIFLLTTYSKSVFNYNAWNRIKFNVTWIILIYLLFFLLFFILNYKFMHYLLSTLSHNQTILIYQSINYLQYLFYAFSFIFILPILFTSKKFGYLFKYKILIYSIFLILFLTNLSDIVYNVLSFLIFIFLLELSHLTYLMKGKLNI